MKERALSGFPKSETKEKGKQLLPFGCGELPVLRVSVSPTHLPATQLYRILSFSLCVLGWERLFQRILTWLNAQPPRAIAQSCRGKSTWTLVETFNQVMIHLHLDGICTSCTYSLHESGRSFPASCGETIYQAIQACERLQKAGWCLQHLSEPSSLPESRNCSFWTTVGASGRSRCGHSPGIQPGPLGS